LGQRICSIQISKILIVYCGYGVSASAELADLLGWMLSLGWLASVASSVYVVVTLIEVMIDIFNESFSFTSWQYTLMMIAFTVLTIFLNTWGAPVLPMLETVSLIFHLAGWIVTIVALLVLCPKNSSVDVFTTFSNDSGWPNTGASLLITQVTILYCNLGSDSVVHICRFPPAACHS
jgi:choline transport protein